MTCSHECLKYLELSRISPQLEYQIVNSTKFTERAKTVKTAIDDYFQTQPQDYRKELADFSLLNQSNCTTQAENTCWVFVPCFNEDHNIVHLISLFDKQNYPFELCFIVNCPENSTNYRRLVKSIRLILDAKATHNNIHLVAKVFKPELASLGRARKYGFDYCLQRISEAPGEKADRAFVVCAEGDTLELSSSYLNEYAKCFQGQKSIFVQGQIAYPEKLLKHSPALSIFTKVRENVHAGQGQYFDELPEFGGLMPCGRNFAISPMLYTLIGGIDPIKRDGPEDDIIMGNDIRRLLGEDCKKTSMATLITSPRREVLIVKDVLAGYDNNLKKAYENFHNSFTVRDYNHSEIEQIVLKVFPKCCSKTTTSILVSQLYQWVLSTVLKSSISHINSAKAVKYNYDNHNIGYWEKESSLWNIAVANLAKMPAAKRIESEDLIADQALRYFNEFNSTLNLRFFRSNHGIQSQISKTVILNTVNVQFNVEDNL